MKTLLSILGAAIVLTALASCTEKKEPITSPVGGWCTIPGGDFCACFSAGGFFSRGDHRAEVLTARGKWFPDGTLTAMDGTPYVLRWSLVDGKLLLDSGPGCTHDECGPFTFVQDESLQCFDDVPDLGPNDAPKWKDFGMDLPDIGSSDVITTCQPVCNTATDCPQGLEHCVGGQCVMCETDAECPAIYKGGCDPTRYTCRLCLTDTDCEGRPMGTGKCGALGACLGCSSDADCVSTTPGVVMPSKCGNDGYCVDCFTDADCSGTDRCVVSHGMCVTPCYHDLQCQPGMRCLPVE